MAQRKLTHGRISDLSLRAKFKDADVLEVTVVDHATGELFQTQWNFRKLAKEQPALVAVKMPDGTYEYRWAKDLEENNSSGGAVND